LHPGIEECYSASDQIRLPGILVLLFQAQHRAGLDEASTMFLPVRHFRFSISKMDVAREAISLFEGF